MIEGRYRPLVALTVRHRWLTLVASLSFLLITAGLLTSGRIKYIDFPGGDKDEVEAEVVLPYGVDVSETEKVMNQLIAAARRTITRMGGESSSQGILSTIGIGRHNSVLSSNITSVTVLLVPLDERELQLEGVRRGMAR